MFLLHFDSSKRCVCPLYKFLYAFKVVKLFLKHPVLIKTPFYNLYTPFQHVSSPKRPSSESTIDTFQWHLAAGMCTAEMYQLHLAAGMHKLYSLRMAL